MNDTLTPTARAVAHLLHPAGSQDTAPAKGVYTVTCKEVIPALKLDYDVKFQRYLRVLADIDYLRKGIDGLSGMAVVDRIVDLTRNARSIEDELQAFPMQDVWTEVIDNVVCTVGKNLALDSFIAGSAYTATGPYMGLISSVSWTNLNTTLASLVSYSSVTGIASITTTAAHGVIVNDTAITIASPTGTGANITSLAGTFTPQTGTTGSTLNIFVGTGLTITTVTGGTLTTTSGTRAGDTMASHGNWTEAGSTNAPTFAARGTPAWSAAAAGTKSTSAAVSFTMTASGTLQGCFITYGTGAVTTLMNTSGTILSAGAFTGGSQAVSNGNVVTVTYSLSM